MEESLDYIGMGMALALASRLVHHEPTDEEMAAYFQPGMFASCPVETDDEAVGAGLSLLDGWCSSTVGAAKTDSRSNDDIAALLCDAEVRERIEEVKRDWLVLIAGAGAPKAPSWAGFYLNPGSTILGESSLGIRKLYRSFGFEIERKGREPDDDLGAMLAFLSFLCGEAEAQASRSSGSSCMCATSETSDATACARSLLVDYLLPWLPAWRWGIAKYARTDFYRGAGELVFGLIRTFAGWLGIRYRDDDAPRFVLAR